MPPIEASRHTLHSRHRTLLRLLSLMLLGASIIFSTVYTAVQNSSLSSVTGQDEIFAAPRGISIPSAATSALPPGMSAANAPYESVNAVTPNFTITRLDPVVIHSAISAPATVIELDEKNSRTIRITNGLSQSLGLGQITNVVAPAGL